MARVTDLARPNLVVVLSDDHAAHAISAYGSRINQTPHLDRLAEEGMRFDACFCTNSICTPSRASILTGQYSHHNGVRTLSDTLDNTLPQVQGLLRAEGYQTALFGKWHLGHGPGSDPSGFDDWAVLPGQGDYHDPQFHHPDGVRRHLGYVTDLTTDLALDWLDHRDASRPFLLMVNHKAPHRPWEPDEQHAHLYEDLDLPVPDTFDDDHVGRHSATREVLMTMSDLNARDLKAAVPPGLTHQQERHWRYQRYIKDYLRCVASLDDNMVRLLDHLDAEGLTDNTVVIYTSDQGFFLGDHGWFDKRFMYEESLRMPLLVRYPTVVAPGSTNSHIVTNIDFAPTLLQLAGVPVPAHMDGPGFAEQLSGQPPRVEQDCAYYRYWEHLSQPHRVPAHWGIRTTQHKLIYFPTEPGDGADGSPPGSAPGSWELYDLSEDSHELHNLADDPQSADLLAQLQVRLNRKRHDLGDR